MTSRQKCAVAGLLGGLAHVLIAGGSYVYFFGGPLYSFEGLDATVATISGYGGAVLLGALPAVLFVHKRLVTPGFTVTVIAVAAVVSSLSGPGSPQFPTDFAWYFMGWFVPLSIAIGIGVIEELLRTRIGGRRQSAVLDPSRYSRHTQRAALGGGLGYVLVLLASMHWAYGTLPGELLAALFNVQVGPWIWWAITGGAVVGAVLAVALVRHGLLSPLVSVAVVYVVMLYEMWKALQGPHKLLPGTPLDLYLIGWPLLLGLTLALGRVERVVRSRSAAESTPEPN